MSIPSFYRYDFKTIYEGDIASNLVKSDRRNFTIDLSQIPIPSEYLQSKVPVKIELVATRSLGDTSTEQTLSWEGEVKSKVRSQKSEVRSQKSENKGTRGQGRKNNSRFPIPDSRFPIPDSRFPIPSPQSPVPSPQSPIPNLFSLVLGSVVEKFCVDLYTNDTSS